MRGSLLGGAAARLLLLVVVVVVAVDALPAPPAGTPDAALATLSRALGGRDASSLFTVALSPAAPCASVTGGGPGQPVVITASTAVDAVYAAGRYLSATVNASFSWEATGGVTVPLGPTDPLPPVPGGGLTLCRAKGAPWTYYQNVVQHSYSNVWWTLDRWEAELDWMALRGVNVFCSYTGQESLWRTAFAALGLNDTVLGAYFGGPAYLAWSRGQGLQGVGGPLPDFWYSEQLSLAQGIVSRALALGIVPILPAFQGNVPPALHFLYPSANISKDGWLDVFDPLFGRVQDLYFAALQAAIPTTGHFYEADGLFSHASGPWAAAAVAAAAPREGDVIITPDPDAQARSRAAYASIAKWDSQAVWVYQTWIWRGFSSASDLAYLQGWLSGPPPGSFFLLDQTAERVPIWQKFNNFSFLGNSFVWLSMNEMGGNLGLMGSLDAVTDGVEGALASSQGACVGVGIDPEGINNNPGYFEFVLDSVWTASTQGDSGGNSNNEDEPRRRGAAVADSASALADWGVRRCGHEDPRIRQAYSLLAATVYAANQSNYEHHMHYCPVALPLAGNGWNSPVTRPEYAAAPLAQAWGLLLAAAPTCPSAGVLYDLVDVAREFISLFPCVDRLDALTNATTLPALAAASAALNETVGDLDALLAAHTAFLVGRWIADARALGAASNGTEADLVLLEWNARSQITTWFPTPNAAPGNGLYDYGNKQWAGVTRDYHLQRYALYADAAAAAIRAGTGVNKSAYVASLTALAGAWTTANVEGGSVYPTEPTGDPVEVAGALFAKYGKAAAAAAGW
jgi:alpha-N-acetylglucosaminidase